VGILELLYWEKRKSLNDISHHLFSFHAVDIKPYQLSKIFRQQNIKTRSRSVRGKWQGAKNARMGLLSIAGKASVKEPHQIQVRAERGRAFFNSEKGDRARKTGRINHAKKCAEKKKKNCEQCKEIYISRNASQKFCSRLCQGKNKQRPVKLCVYCNCQFKPEETGRKFCSVACASKARIVFLSGIKCPKCLLEKCQWGGNYAKFKRIACRACECSFTRPIIELGLRQDLEAAGALDDGRILASAFQKHDQEAS
jgi:hypothetical protein